LSRNLGTLAFWNPLGHPRPVTGLLYLLLLEFKAHEGGKKGIDKSENSLTKNGIKESDEATYENIDRCVEYQMRKDRVNMLHKIYQTATCYIKGGSIYQEMQLGAK
jgi:hypothetical protein